MSYPRTLGELKESGYRQRSVRQELRENLIARLRRGDPLFPEMVGYADSVVPAVEHALLAGHDMVFLGERGQGKTRMIRALVELLDAEIPVVEGSEVNDDPFAPVSLPARERVAELGDRTPVAWLPREQRYGEKLATPDVTIADLLGEIDPIRVAEGRYLADESVIHYGLVPRTNRGIFCINELPDLSEKVQVGLFNVMEERDFQVKGFKVRLPLDILIVASANPEDYTRRGRIITPLKDRYQAQIRTHYPETRPLEIEVMEQERREHAGVCPIFVPDYLREIIAELTLLARRSPDISQVSGVSVRASIANYETLIAAAERRALRLDEAEAVPRVSDLESLVASTGGKIEPEYGGTDQDYAGIFDKLLRQAVKTVFDERLDAEGLDDVVAAFEDGWKVEVGSLLPASDYVEGLDRIPGLKPAVVSLEAAGSAGQTAAAIEFVLEGLHLSNRLNKDVQGQSIRYGGA
ncbi:MAG: sigma 54-interacting transcriptional regulator [Proteobacteria bacterium]|nr:sigma 54-interacting transcriptional regulator [Pseudomonadota bacterium]